MQDLNVFCGASEPGHSHDCTNYYTGVFEFS